MLTVRDVALFITYAKRNFFSWFFDEKGRTEQSSWRKRYIKKKKKIASRSNARNTLRRLASVIASRRRYLKFLLAITGWSFSARRRKCVKNFNYMKVGLGSGGGCGCWLDGLDARPPHEIDRALEFRFYCLCIGILLPFPRSTSLTRLRSPLLYFNGGISNVILRFLSRVLTGGNLHMCKIDEWFPIQFVLRMSLMVCNSVEVLMDFMIFGMGGFVFSNRK